MPSRRRTADRNGIGSGDRVRPDLRCHVDTDVAEHLNDDMVRRRRNHGGRRQPGRSCDQSGHRAGGDGDGRPPDAAADRQGPVEHGGLEGGPNLALPEEFACLGGPRGGHDQPGDAVLPRSEEGHDVVRSDAATVRGAAVQRTGTGVRGAATLHIRNPTLAAHRPLHHHFSRTGAVPCSTLIGNDSLDGEGEAPKTPVAEDPHRTGRAAHDFGNRGNR